MSWPLLPQLPSGWPFPGRPEWAGSCCSALDVGGDFYEVLPLSDSSLLMAIADVMGKGGPAAFFADALRTLIRALAEPELDPARLLADLNHLLFEELSRAGSFITVQLALADLCRRRLHIASAGHCPLLIGNDNGRVRSLSPNGMPLGIQLDAQFRAESAPLPLCGLALLYTDGITETRDPQGRLFGQERLEQWMVRALRQYRSAVQLKQELLRELARFQGPGPRADDQTFLILADGPPAALAWPDHRPAAAAFAPTPPGASAGDPDFPASA